MEMKLKVNNIGICTDEVFVDLNNQIDEKIEKTQLMAYKKVNDIGYLERTEKGFALFHKYWFNLWD